MTTEDGKSKAEKLIEANRKRKEAEQANADANKSVELEREDLNKEDQATKDQKIDAAEKRAEIKVEAMAGTMDGNIDVEAMGDVKGDGGDAKDYDDGDPDKALGVPVYEHGLGATRDGGDVYSPAAEEALEGKESRMSSQTKAEIEAGRAALEGRDNAERNRRRTQAELDGSRTVVTDDETDPEGDAGKAKAEAKARAKAKADAAK